METPPELLWTLAELEKAVMRALGDGLAPSGRVRAVPDARAIRYYTTLGLLDRPTIAGRTARYRRRHLLQLVAIKRLQAQGRSLAEVQTALAGATTRQLEQVAQLDAAAQAPTPAAPSIAGQRTPPAQDIAPSDADQSAPAAAEQSAPSARPPAARFWAQAPAATAPHTTQTSVLGSPIRPVALQGVPLAGGAMVLVPAAQPLTPADVAAVRAAAAPLLDLLITRRLTAAPPITQEDSP
jgi:DNA-binding transcriptional MerR regulator